MLAWAAPAPTAQMRPMRSRKSSVFVENLGRDGVKLERPGRHRKAENSPKELGEVHWFDLFRLGGRGGLHGVMFIGPLFRGGVRVFDGGGLF